MSTWVLILIFAYGGSAVDHVPGFDSKASCDAAGQQFVQTAGKGLAKYVCVEQKSESK